MEEAFVLYAESAMDLPFEVASFASAAEAEAALSEYRHEYVSYGVLPRSEFEAYAEEEVELAFG